jgi:signal transduction histidine kinase/CheY-like chemotaxis protein
MNGNCERINNSDDKYIEMIDMYNDIYDSYLKGIKPFIFYHIMILRFIHIIGSNCGVLLAFNNKTNKLEIITHGTNNTTNNDMFSDISEDWHIFSDYINNVNTLDENSLIMKSLMSKEIIVSDSCSFNDIIGINDIHNKYNDDRFTRIKKGMIFFIPIIFFNQSIGIIITCFKNELCFNHNHSTIQYDHDNDVLDIHKNMNIIRHFSLMVGVLMNNVNAINKTKDNEKNYNNDHNNENDNINNINDINRSITFQVLHDSFNMINDAITITDKDMKIIYYNDQFVKMLQKHYCDDNNHNDNNIKSNLIDIIPQTISLLSNEKTCFFNNKKLEIITKSFNNIELYVNSISSCGCIYHTIKVCDVIDKDNTINGNNGNNGNNSYGSNNKNNSKNLVAYLSHELRNPIQVISTGIYIIERSVNEKEKNTHTTKICDQNTCDVNKLDDFVYVHEDELDSLKSTDSLENIKIDTDASNISDIHDIFETSRSVVKRISNACKNINIIINDILDLSKIDNDEMTMNLDEHDLHELTDVIYDEAIQEAHKKGLNIEYEYDKNNPSIIYTDNTRVFQIISNLISNSIKYSNTGTIKFKVKYNTNSNDISFEVSDQGKGIRKEELSNLFKPFGKTSNSGNMINSNGLGLFVCQKIANLLGGKIDVHSEYKKGSTFTFTHPIKLGYSNPNIRNNMNIRKNIIGRILIVDDDPNITSLFKLLLKCMNYDEGYDLTVDTVNSGEKAIYLTNKISYDLIFMDIDLDGEDGCLICDQINQLMQSSQLNISHMENYKVNTCPIIAVTANIKSIQNDRDQKFNCFTDVILKPFNNDEINKVIYKYLSR